MSYVPFHYNELHLGLISPPKEQVSPVEVLLQSLVQDALRQPGPLLWTLALSFHDILHPQPHLWTSRIQWRSKADIRKVGPDQKHSDLPKEQGWQKAQGGHERRHSSGGKNFGVLGVLSPREESALGPQMLSCHTHCKMLSSIWLALSVWPLDWGWSPKNKLTVAPSTKPKLSHVLAVIWVPRFDRMSQGSPWRRKTWRSSNSPVSTAEGSFCRDTKWDALEKRSTIVRITVCPSEGGRPILKSSAIYNQECCGISRGCYRRWRRHGHPNHRRPPEDVTCSRLPGDRPALEHTGSGMNNRFLGMLSRSVTDDKASWTCSSTWPKGHPYHTAWRKSWGKVGLGLVRGEQMGPALCSWNQAAKLTGG